jgi:phosphate transport system permease protein
MRRRRQSPTERLFEGVCLAAVAFPLLMLGALVVQVAIEGAPRMDTRFLTAGPSRIAGNAGIYPAVIGSLSLIALTAALAIPIGVGAAIYLEEYGRNSRFARIVELNIANLAGVPSIIYGLLGLEVFVRTLGLGRSLLAGACTMALLVLPVIIMASREALRTVPGSLREASFALGATRWQTIRQVVLPMATPGVLTGIILAVSRAIGETAPLIVVGALAFISDPPSGLMSPFTVLPIQIFNWVSRPQEAFAINAAAGILVLMVTLLVLNATAIILRDRMQRRFH